jgi:hypothetical protein
VHDSLDAMLEGPAPRVWTLSTRGSRAYTDVATATGDLLLFGPETRGLPQAVIDRLGVHRCLRIPMRTDSRSLNLSNAAALVLYEGLRQQGFPGYGLSADARTAVMSRSGCVAAVRRRRRGLSAWRVRPAAPAVPAAAGPARRAHRS